MRIAQVAPLFESVPPKLYGGTERVVSYLTEELVRQGHDVTLFASGDSVTCANLVPICPESLRLNPLSRDQIAYHILMLERVFAQQENYDLIHFHIDYLHFPLSRAQGIVNLTTLHGRLDLPDLVPLYRAFSDMPVISISDSQRAPLPWINWQGTVHHGIAEDDFALYNNRGNYLAFLGRISPEKGVDHAIEIATRFGMPLKIAAKVDRADREYFDSVIKPLLEHPLVEWIGEIGYEEKNAFLGNAFAVLFPVNWPEPFGLVMIESMACGTPVIAYPRGSVPEIMQDGVTGFIVNDVAAATEALAKVSYLDRSRVRLSFEQRFTATRMANDYLAIYERLIATRKPETVTYTAGVPVG